MNRNNAELSSIVPFKKDGFWYLKLVYKYEDEKGNKHTVIIPKVAIPFQHYRSGSKYASREMTLDEIEKELGYKVKIINKEPDNRPII